MATSRWFLVLALVGCVDSSSEDDTQLAETDIITLAGDSPADGPSWEPGDTLHANTTVFSYASTQERRVHSLWIAGSPDAPVKLKVSALAGDGYDVRIAVLGPIEGGTRRVVAADGYSAAKRSVDVTLDATASGEHLVVVGSYGLLRDSAYELTAACTDCDSKVDVLASPKQFALVGDQGLVQMQLGEVMQGFGADIQVDLYASPPMQSWNATQIGTSYASGTQVNSLVPESVKPGDDIRLVVREAGGRVLDTGVTTRYLPTASAFARLDAILYGDIASLQISGVVGFYEGVADLRLRSETYKREVAQHTLRADQPGHVGNGFGAFDATFMPDLSVAARDGELLSVGFINGNGDYRRLGCFEYCNNLSGMSSCTGGPRSCP